jgi:hypothetical protein
MLEEGNFIYYDVWIQIRGDESLMLEERNFISYDVWSQVRGNGSRMPEENVGKKEFYI